MNELDYFECCFLRAFRFLRIDYLRRKQLRSERFVPLPEQGDGSENSDEEQLRLPKIEVFPRLNLTTFFGKERLAAIRKLAPDAGDHFNGKICEDCSIVRITSASDEPNCTHE